MNEEGRESMKKIFAIGALVIALVLAGCPTNANDGNSGNDTQSGTTLKLQNETFTDLVDITWGGVSFASTCNPWTLIYFLGRGGSQRKEIGSC